MCNKYIYKIPLSRSERETDEINELKRKIKCEHVYINVKMTVEKGRGI